jgi:drug/metabolite transporter (DMT)-like permease
MSPAQPTYLRSDAAASVAVAFSGALWGLFWIPLRHLESYGLSGNWANIVLYAAASLLLLPAILRRARPSRQDLGRLVVIGLLSGLGFSLWNNALLYGAVVRVTLLFYLSPVWATLLGLFLLGDRIGPLRLLSILFGLGGAGMVLRFDGILPLPRDFAEWSALVSGISFALMSVYVRKSRDVSVIEKTFANQIFALPFAALFLLVNPAPSPTAQALLESLPLILLGCIWLVPVMFLILWGATRLDPGRVSVLLLFEVLAAAVSAALLTDDPFGWREMTGCLFILAAGLIEGIDQLRQSRAGNREASAAAH